MSRLSTVSILAVIAMTAALAAPGKDKEVEWKKGVVVNAARHGSPETRSVEEQFDIDAGDVVYTAQEDVMVSQAQYFQPGTHVEFAIDGKKILLRGPDSKIRKMTLHATYPKHRKTAHEITVPTAPFSHGSVALSRRFQLARM